jgi:3-oxo-5alpha-steroid 4-dehydrogenase
MVLPILMTLIRNCKRGNTVAAAAAHYNLPVDALEATVRAYNEDCLRGEDRIGKSPNYLRALGPGPYYIIDISTGNQKTVCGSIPMGGLRVNEATGNVVRSDGSDVPGLYAAGRNAIGIPSHFYVSGTSIADCVFSGRRAGLNAAAASAQRWRAAS